MIAKEEVKVTVIIPAFNQERYVEQSVMSALSQKTSFPFEVIVCDDASSDVTPELLKRLRELYPDRLKLILRKKNLGPNRNGYGALKHARGQYIAYLEGDDYWIDENKLQKQASFLDENPKYSAVCGRTVVVNERGETVASSTGHFDFHRFEGEEFTFSDFERWRMPGHVNALMARNYLPKEFDKGKIIFRASRFVGDRTLVMIFASHGPIACTKDDVLAYRFNENGKSNWMSRYQKENLRGEDHLYMCRLEQYSREHLGRVLDLSDIKKERLVGAAALYAMCPSKRNFEVLSGIIRRSNPESKAFWEALSVIIKKAWSYHVLKSDKRV